MCPSGHLRSSKFIVPVLYNFIAADQNIRLYDTRRGRFNLQRTVKARDVGWSVLDVCFTPDAQHVLYSSWSGYSKATVPLVNLC